MGIESLLLPSKPIKITSGIDRYGFSSIIANNCGLLFVPRSFANWTHGWIWYEDPNAEDLMSSNLPKDLTIVVRNEVELIALKDWGFNNVRIGGLPFSYVSQQHTYRNKDDLLVFPMHSDETLAVNHNAKEYFDYIESHKKNFESIYVSVYWSDIGGAMHRDAIDRGFHVIRGARPDDANSMLRMRAIFDAFEYVTTNCMGSHFIYALYAGCKVSFSGPMCQMDKLTISKIARQYRYRDDYIDRAYWYSSEPYLRQKFNKYFKENPRFGLADIYYANGELGEKHMLSQAEIIDVLGWSLKGQINGYASGAVRRLSRILSIK